MSASLRSLPDSMKGAGLEREQLLGGTYRVVGRLDQGGMATVYEAEHIRLHRPVAVKVLASHLTNDDDAVSRFHQEANLLSQLQHPHIVTVLDFDVLATGEPYLVMERLDGETLGQRMARECPLQLEEALRIVLQLASGLAAAHAAAIVHRDLKPDNVFLVEAPGEGAFAKLLDFGISKSGRSVRQLTVGPQLLGTPEYMAPEQARGRTEDVSPRTDQYALGLIAYEMLTGYNPFGGGDLYQTLTRVIEHEAPRPSAISAALPQDVDAILARALRKNPTHRFESVTEFAEALARAAGHEGLIPPRSERPSSGVRRSDRAAKPNAGTERSPTSGETARQVLIRIDQARAAFGNRDLCASVEHAEAALALTGAASDPAIGAAVNLSRRLLEHIFATALGPLDRVLSVRSRETDTPSGLCPTSAFVLSRLEDGMTIAEVIDVAGIEKLEVLRALNRLRAVDSIRFD